MISFLLLRMLRIFLTLLGVLVIAFVLGRATGDPAAMMMPIEATDADIQRTRQMLGLDRPIPVQFVAYVGNILQGDFGTSIARQRPALDVVMDRVPATIALGVPAFVLAVVLGIPAGLAAAYSRNRFLDHLLMSWSLAGQSLPSFFLGIALILIVSVQLNLTPTFGNDTWRHYILPTFTLTVYPLAIIIRLTRSSVLEVLSSDYVRTARAKGLNERHVSYIHVLRNALVPVVTVIGLQVAGIISGSAIVETVFAWPGIGALAVSAVGQRDFPVIQTVVLLTAFSFSLVNVAVDVIYVWLDPRIRHA